MSDKALLDTFGECPVRTEATRFHSLLTSHVCAVLFFVHSTAKDYILPGHLLKGPRTQKTGLEWLILRPPCALASFGEDMARSAQESGEQTAQARGNRS